MSVMANFGVAVCCVSAYENANSIKSVSKFVIMCREVSGRIFVSLLFLGFHVMSLEALRFTIHSASLFVH